MLIYKYPYHLTHNYLARSLREEEKEKMRTITLSSESVALRKTPSPSKTLKSSHFSLNSNLSHPYASLFFSRYSGQFRSNLNNVRYKSPLHTNPGDSCDKEFRVLGSGSSNATELMHNMDDCTLSGESIFIDKSRGKRSLLADIPNNLKYMLLCGFFTLEGTHQAVAASDFAGGMQSASFFGDLSDISSGFASAFLLIFFSELGDKTFFIAALLAARNSAAVTFIGTFGALSIMTVISVLLGRTFHYVDDILPFRFGNTDLPIDDIAAVILLVYFGVSTLLEASSGDGLKAEEEQKEAELAVSELRGNGAGILAAANTVISTFFLVFVAEWGDKSFFSTIALAAASSPLGVIGGALAGHGFATLLAVLGGSLLGTFLSEKVIAYIGGSLFLVFAAVTLIEIVN